MWEREAFTHCIRKEISYHTHTHSRCRDCCLAVVSQVAPISYWWLSCSASLQRNSVHWRLFLVPVCCCTECFARRGCWLGQCRRFLVLQSVVLYVYVILLLGANGVPTLQCCRDFSCHMHLCTILLHANCEPSAVAPFTLVYVSNHTKTVPCCQTMP